MTTMSEGPSRGASSARTASICRRSLRPSSPMGVPTLLTHGALDDEVPLEISERFARASGATLVVEPDEEHYGHLEPDNPLWKAVIEWL